MKKYAKTTLCMALSAAMLFTSTGMTVLAEENVQAEETQQEVQAEETSTDMVSVEEEITEEAPVREETMEQVSEEKDSGEEVEESTVTEKNSGNNVTLEEQTDSEDASAEEDLTQQTESEVVSTEEVTTDTEEDLTEQTESEVATTEDVEETEVSENELKLTFSDTDIAHGEYKKDGNNITWVIDANGKLTLEGTGSFGWDRPWENNKEDVKSAVINVKGMKYASGLFRDCSNLATVDLSSFDTSNVTSMSSMFRDCSRLTSLDLSGFDTSNVTSMNEMFSGCSSLIDIDMSNFNTSNVTSMWYMFSGCSSLTDIDVSNFNTSSVTDIYGMFYNCSSLKTLDVSGFDTSKATNMSGMFNGCSSLKTLDVSGFDMSSVTSMSGMFNGCSGLTTLNVSGFCTSRVTDMSGMFRGCSELKTLDVSDFDTSRVTDMRNMFLGCSGLTSLDVSRFDTRRATDMASMFENCSSLTNLDVSSFDTSSVTSMSGMFENCSSLTNLDVSGFDTGSVIHIGSMFEGCSGLTSLNVSGFNTSSVTGVHGMSLMFRGCSGLTSLDVSNFDTSSITDMNNMFRGCSGLTSLDLSNFDTSSITDMNNMFRNCSGLTSLDVSNFDTSSVTNMIAMFSGCSGLTSLDVSGFNTSNVTGMGGMFRDCSGLTSLDVSNFDTSSATSMENMFSGCSGLTSLDVSNFDTSKVTYIGNMFSGCGGLMSLDLSSFDLENVNRGFGLCENCDALTKLYTPRTGNGLVSLDLTGSWYDIEGNSYESKFPERTLICKGETPQAPIAHITARKVKTFYSCGETPNTDDITVMYYSAEGTAKKLAQTEYTTNVSSIDMGTAGEKTLTVNYNALTVDIRLTVGNLLDNTNVTIMFPNADAYNYVFDRKSKKPLPVVVYSVDGASVTLTENTDYTVSYRNNKNAYKNDAEAETVENAPTVMITGCGSYCGTVTKTFEILKAPTPVLEEVVYTVKPYTSWVRIDIASYLVKYGSRTGYVVGTPIEDNVVSGNVLVGEPYINDDRYFGCEIKGAAGDFVTIPVTVSFQNYEDSILNVKIVIEGTPTIAKKKVTISGIEIKDSVYNKLPISYTGTAKAEADSMDVTSSVKLTYAYSGTQADGTAYASTQNAPVNAGNYKLTVAVAEDDQNYTGSTQYPFTITKAPLTITARDMGLKIGAPLPNVTDYKYDTTGLLEGDSLATEPTLVCSITDTTEAAAYDITVSGADAGMNYDITYKNGTLTVSETGESAVYYTVTFNLSGHGSDVTNTGVKEGSFLEKPQEPQADGYTFTGWYKDQSCTVLWDFDKDTVQSDTIIYAGWKINGTGDGGDSDDQDDKDDSPYEDSERIDLKPIGAIANIKAKVYDGNAYEPVVKVTATVDGKKITLTEGADYRILYKNNVNAGTGTVVVRGNGEYKGEIPKDFTISQKPVKKLKVLTGGISGVGSLQTCPVYVYDGTKLLQFGKDYTLSDYTTVKANSAQVTVKAVESGNYTGSVIAKLTVYEEGAKIISPENVKLKETAVAYTGKAVKPEVTVTVDNTPLTNKDYKVQYQNNKDAGTAYVIVTGKGAYKGKAVVPFTIKAETNGFTIKEIKAATYNGKLQKPAVSVSIQKNGKAKKLSKKDYTVTYKNNLHAGKAAVIVTGKGNYAGLSATAEFTINPQQIKKASLKGTQGSLVLMYNKRKLKEGTDYEKPVYGAVNKNKVTVTITGKGDFTDKVTKTVKTQ